MKFIISLCCLLFLAQTTIAQKPKRLSSNELFEKIESLNFFGTVLYVAAHPDDENTRLISYASNKLKARTVYLSLTRGDGGQNLIGPEIRESLGVIRTQELLAARNVDGGEQLFSRANDFGYSKHPEETLSIWDREKVLADVVWAIRTVKPDVIINRFDHRTPGTTHGHHTASAMLSYEAFDLASDKNSFKNQLAYTDTWKPSRMFFNTSWWFYGSHDKFENANKDKFLDFDIGVYYPQKGMSNNEIAAIASSQHLCQGFGRLSQRGTEKEYIEFLKGDFPTDKSNLFSGIDTSWKRVKGGSKIFEILSEVQENFDFKSPSKHISQLVEAYQLIQTLEDPYWRNRKTVEITEVIEACLGLYIEATAAESSATPGQSIPLQLEILNRSNVSVMLDSYEIVKDGKSEVKEKNTTLLNNIKILVKDEVSLKNVAYSSPYWLNTKASLGMYYVDDQRMVGKPESEQPLKIIFNINVKGQQIPITKNVVYRYAKRDKGELYQPFAIVPKVTVSIPEKVILFNSNKSKKITVNITAGEDDISGTVELCYPEGWKVSPKQIPFQMSQKGAILKKVFEVTPPNKTAEGKISGLVRVGNDVFEKEKIEIAYDHIPKQTILKNSESKVVRLEIEKKGKKIAYVEGAGDVVPESLSQIGYDVERVSVESITLEKLQEFDAVVLGIRAYNTQEKLAYKQETILQYVKAGGKMIVQYNTAGRRRVDVMAPFELLVSRDRVTDEKATVVFLDKKHPLLNTPNKIKKKDFDGWVQERGLYFPNKWAEEFTPILGMHDKGEPQKNGSLLVAHYGKGVYIYTGLSFFRELPAGVPGAYKLFANLLSYEQ
ncbi:PIG-L family deacetylase [Flavicella marina]|uniref:PIG-L family deacetylase n=1 Tax=Flavicella marina TaxID=1475951 RepID=UPI001264FE5C|nr:PIG-L family deacetylase [Flavicella marina]